MEQEIKQIDRGWLEGAAKTITFIVTKYSPVRSY